MTAPTPLRPDPSDMPADHDSLCPCGVCARLRQAAGHVTPAELRRRRMAWPPIDPTAQRERLRRRVRISKGQPCES